MTVSGMIVGAAVAQNFGLAGNADSVVDAHVAVENITRFAQNQGYQVSVAEDGPDYRLTLKRS